ncbi:hypothetical protein ADL22_12280 [Streptomyces sp. NRRL F-4489]|uniref:hypothetical protein n=1 Tax=Streptomyces sp. NRRL F-4489 TaxID=1609095 RepID=UPI000749528A|nr:hypothetical protein [Streptomyces sp. NRRL F-4489]KUL44714.1 hypothetical protein ADL22_12280 [Streptomyces sp. NRRL F-4489]
MTLIDTNGDLADPYQAYIAKSRYARWRDDLGRRETWTETVDRFFQFMTGHLKEKHGYTPEKELAHQLRDAVLNHEVLPSMRALMTAGEALDLSNVAGYNCAYTPIDDIRSLSEVLFILLNGTGVGFSVERRYVDKLPPVAHPRLDLSTVLRVGDSKQGWAEAYAQLLDLVWLQGRIPTVNYDRIRPAGSRLKTFGGRASGPEPLRDLFEFTVELLRVAQGRKLRPIEAHDLVCKIASVVVVGGVRRSALISLSDLDDQEMALAKSGEWWESHPYRKLANNSAVYHDGVTREQFDAEWRMLKDSGSGERGIFHRDAARRIAARWGRREPSIEYGTNPCSEIILRPRSFCNLSTVVVRPQDRLAELKRKITLAAILGTWQATLTGFPFLREEWSRNAEEERLLGVSMTGIFGNRLLTDGRGRELKNQVLELLRDEARVANELEAEMLGIPAADAITAIKPEGTTSQMADVPSGLHPPHSRYWVRTVRSDVKDPISDFLIDAGVPHEMDVLNDQNLVFSFPQQAAAGSRTRDNISAIQHLDLWLDYQRHYCEHKPSVTISVRGSEWEEVRDWVWKHLHELSGVAFLPYSDHTYAQAPYQECDYATYRHLTDQMPRLVWSDLVFYEGSDHTTGSQEYACSANGCDVR